MRSALTRFWFTSAPQAFLHYGKMTKTVKLITYAALQRKDDRFQNVFRQDSRFLTGQPNLLMDLFDQRGTRDSFHADESNTLDDLVNSLVRSPVVLPSEF